MSKPITIPIKKHTKVRRPVSRYKTFTVDHRFGFAGTTIPRLAPQPITDISKGLPDPIQFFDTEIVKQQKGDWNEWHKDMEEQVPKYSGSRIYYSKPSLRNRWLTRIKRIRRKK